MINPKLTYYKKQLRKTYKKIRETDDPRLLKIYEGDKELFKKMIKGLS